MLATATKITLTMFSKDTLLLRLQAERYAALNKKRNLTFRKKYLSLALVS
jgi:hypothetical protein